MTAGSDRVLLKCHAGCDNDDILAALRLGRADLFDEPRAGGNDDWTPCGHGIAREYRYVDEAGSHLFTVVRCPRKDFAQWRPDPTATSGRRWNLRDTRRVLYHLPQVIEAVTQGKTIWLVEGEKDADRLASIGVAATCNPHGAGKWKDDYASTLAGADVVVVADRDEPGRRHAAAVQASLLAANCHVRIVEAASGKDISEHLDAGHTLDQVCEPEPASPTEPATLADVGEVELLEQATRRELRNLRARRAAELVLRNELAPGIPDPVRLDALLAEPEDPVQWRIESLWPRHGRVMLSAGFKSGKTTLRDNLVRSLVDGDGFSHRFLDAYDVEPITDGTLAVIDVELSRNMLRSWLRDQGIRNEDRVWVVPLRGRAASFDLTDPDRLIEWAKILRAQCAKVLIIDCLGPILAALGLDENKGLDVGRWLAGLEALLDEAGIEEALVLHHMGHDAERSRGASRLRDWPDAEWKLVREQDEAEKDIRPDAGRYFSALGRDVSVSESLLLYDPIDRHMRLGNGNRRQTKAERDVPAVVEYLTENPGQGVRQIQTGMEAFDISRDKIRAAIAQAKRSGVICMHKDGQKCRHFVKADCAECAEPCGP